MKTEPKTKLAIETFDKLMTIIDRWNGLDLLDPLKSKMDSPRMIRNFPFYRNATMFPFDKKYVGEGLPFFPTNYVISSKGKFVDGEEMISVALIIETKKMTAKSRFQQIEDAIKNSEGKYSNIKFLYTTPNYIKKLLTTYDEKYMEFCDLSVTEIIDSTYNMLDELTKDFESNHRNDGGFNLPGLIEYGRKLETPTAIGEIVMDIIGDILAHCSWTVDRDLLEFEKFSKWLFETTDRNFKKKTKKSTMKFVPVNVLVAEKKKRDQRVKW